MRFKKFYHEYCMLDLHDKKCGSAPLNFLTK
jgi:hypothetical protein